ncbi:cell division protein ZapA [Thermodesulfobacteriota bacterium]
MDKPVKINILGSEYHLKSSENDIDSVYQIAEYVNEKLKETNENIEGLSERKTAILTALNIASDYFQVLQERDELKRKIQKKSESLILSINDNLG